MRVHSLEVIVLQAKIFEIKMVLFDSTLWLNLFFILSIPVIAALSIANVVKSSLGPLGLDKMLVDNIGVVFSFLS